MNVSVFLFPLPSLSLAHPPSLCLFPSPPFFPPFLHPPLLLSFSLPSPPPHPLSPVPLYLPLSIHSFSSSLILVFLDLSLSVSLFFSPSLHPSSLPLCVALCFFLCLSASVFVNFSAFLFCFLLHFLAQRLGWGGGGLQRVTEKNNIWFQNESLVIYLCLSGLSCEEVGCMAAEKNCTVGQEMYRPGQTFRLGCQMCTCQEGGVLNCTLVSHLHPFHSTLLSSCLKALFAACFKLCIN